MKVGSHGAFFRIAVSDEILSKIGNFNISWGELDFVILLVLYEILGIKWDQLEENFGGEQTSARMKALQAAFNEHKDSFSDEVAIPPDLKKLSGGFPQLEMHFATEYG